MRMLRNQPRLSMAALLLLGIAQPALAGVFCVDTAVGLQSSLTTAAANAQDDEVRIVQGTYVGNFVYASTEAHALSVLGGYTTGCAGRVLDPVNTILDGNQTNTVLVLSAPDVAADLLVEGVTLRNGKPASGGGGGLLAKVGTDGAVTVNSNRIENNTTRYHGGGANIYAYNGTATITNNSISGNTTVYNGEGGGAYIAATTTTLTNNSLTGNTARSGGGGADINANTATLTNNSITGNTASNSGGGVDITALTATLTNNSITGNTASIHDGGGAHISTFFGTDTLTNNTFVGNTAEKGGGLTLSPGANETTDSAKLYNNLFWDNVATANEGADLWIDNDGDGDYFPIPVTLLANNFDQAQPTGFSSTMPITIGPSNLNMIDPLFLDASAGDFHLLPGSPMIDAGYPSTPDLPDFDIAGTPRVLGSVVDIGAYEFDENSDLMVRLSVILAGTGSGTVTSSPTGINCGGDCFQAYSLDTLVTLTATPADANSVFDGWSGHEDCADGQVTMAANLGCTATFSAVRQLTVTRAGDGSGRVTSTPTGIDCGAACAAYFYQGEAVALTATPDAISTFASWSGDATCPNPVLTVDRACTANFAPLLYRLYLFVYGTGGGSVTSAPAGITCGADCEEDYRATTVVTLTAAPDANSNFWGWTGPCTGSEPTCEVTLSAVSGLAAIFNLKTYALSVTKAGTGTGTVTSVPEAIDCGTNCQETFDHGALVTLTATPDASATFTGWSGACTGAGACQVTLAGAKSVTATFAQISYIVVTARAGTGGSISPATRSVVQGATTTFTVTPTSGYRIGTVSGCGGSLAGNTYTTGAITAACTVSASFTVLPKYTLTVTKGGTGTVASAPAGISCGSDCSEAYSSGTPVTLTATAGAGYQFASWTGCTSVSGTTCTIAMTGAKSVKATFTLLPKYTLAVTKSGTGTVASTPAGINCGYTCSAAIYSGTSVTLTATAGAGYQFASWTGCNSVSANTCTVAMTGAKAVKATFTLLPKYTLTVTKGGTGTVASAPAGISCGSDCSEAYSSGTSVKLTATAGSGYAFSTWTGCNSVSANTCTVAMTGAKAVRAEFIPAYTLRLAKSAYSYGTVTSAPSGIVCGTTCSARSALFASGTTVTLTATPITGRRFKNWSGACTGVVATSCAVPMTKAQSVTAVFQ